MSKKSPMRGEKTYSPNGVLGNFSEKLHKHQWATIDALATSFCIPGISQWVSTKLFKLNLLFDGVVYYVSQILVTTAGFELRPLIYNAVT